MSQPRYQAHFSSFLYAGKLELSNDHLLKLTMSQQILVLPHSGQWEGEDMGERKGQKEKRSNSWGKWSLVFFVSTRYVRTQLKTEGETIISTSQDLQFLDWKPRYLCQQYAHQIINKLPKSQMETNKWVCSLKTALMKTFDFPSWKCYQRHLQRFFQVVYNSIFLVLETKFHEEWSLSPL